MFEDSIFESAGTIHTRSRQWMVAAFGFNASILMALVLIPLVFPPMLPRMFNPLLLEAYVPPKPQPRQPAQTAKPVTMLTNDPYQAPSIIPHTIVTPAVPDPPMIPDTSLESVLADPNTNLVRENLGKPIVRPVVNAPLHISGPVEEGRILEKRLPVYPAIARAAGISGTVTLEAVISKTGTIENLHVIDGPMMLRQAAQDAVRTWRYRPYLLDGQPVEVQTTVNVIFTLQR
jgi:protein TonB